MRLHPQMALVADLQFGISCPWDCHVYALAAPLGTVLIDAGSGMATDTLLNNLRQDLSARQVAAVVLTHCHADHAAGATVLRARTGCAIFAPQPSRRILEEADEEASGLVRARRQGLYPEDLRLEPCRVDHSFADGEVLQAAGLEFHAIHVRGHSEDSFCLLANLDCGRALFSGDTVFYGGVLGLINATGSSLEGYREDLHRLGGLKVDALFPGHGLFTYQGGQRHIDCALEQLARGVVPRMVGQGDLIF